MHTHKQRTKKQYLASFIVAYVISIKGLNQLLGTILNRTDNIMPINLLLVGGLIALHFFISDKKNNLNLNKKSMLFLYYIISIIVVYKYAYRYSSASYEELLVFVLIPIYLSFYKIDVKKVLEILAFFSVLILPFSDSFFKSTSALAFETIGMTTTYNTLVFVVAAVLHFWYYRESAGMFMWLGYAVNIYYLIKVLLLGNRGPLISLVVFFILLILHKFNKNGAMNKNKLKTMLITIAVGILIIYIVNNFEEILTALDSLLKSMGIEISAISKSVHKLKQGDVSNGRNDIFEFTLQGIKEHFLIGNGISTMLYNSFYTIAYPHNVFLQLWYDLGIIVSIPLFYLIAKATIKTFFDSTLNKNQAVLMILLYTLSIPRLCVSSQLWVDISFWFLIMYTITPNVYLIDEGNESEEVAEEEFISDGKKLL